MPGPETLPSATAKLICPFVFGLPVRSAKAPDVATVASEGRPVRSEYRPEGAIVASVGLPSRSEYCPVVATVESPEVHGAYFSPVDCVLSTIRHQPFVPPTGSRLFVVPSQTQSPIRCSLHAAPTPSWAFVIDTKCRPRNPSFKVRSKEDCRVQAVPTLSRADMPLF